MKEIVQIRENFLTLEEVELLTSELSPFLKDTPPEIVKYTQSAFGLNGSEEGLYLKANHLFSSLTGNEKTDKAIKLFTEVLFRIKNEMESFYNIELVPIQCVLNRILAGGENPTHVDDQTGMYSELEYSGLIYLGNYGEQFFGGEIVFPLQDLKIEQKKGMLVFFKGDEKAPHGVNKVISGYRDNIITFFTNLKKIKERSNEQD